MIFQIVHLFIQQTSRKLAYFCSFCKVFTFYSPRKNASKLTVSQKSTDPHVSVRVSCEPKTSSESSKKQDKLLQNSTELKIEGTKSFTPRHRSSPVTRKMYSVLVQKCNSCQALYHYVPALLQQHHVVLRVV